MAKVSFEVVVCNSETLSVSHYTEISWIYKQLSSSDQVIGWEQIKRLVQEQTFVVAFPSSPKRRDVVIGYATLCQYRQLKGPMGIVEDVVVSGIHRGNGIGRALMECIIAEARKKGLLSLSLTSKPSRVEANKMYPALGFEKRDTNVYRLAL